MISTPSDAAASADASALREASLSEPTPWHPLTRIAFRATFTYFLLTTWIWLDELAIRPTWLVRKIYPTFAHLIVNFFARHLLHTSQVYQPNSFRDTHYLYLLLLGCLLITAVVTVAWSWIDKRRLEYTRLNGYFRVFLRYSLSYMILMYGMDKVIKLQFPAPSLSRLIENYGDSSPMVLMWTFMGYSTAYTIFSGMAEVLAGVLVLFRRTTTLGALIAAGVMLNVTIMDFAYDVSVKIYALNLLLIAVVLITPDARRLADVLVFNRTAPAVPLQKLPMDAGRRWTYVGLKTLIVLYLLVPLVLRNLHTYRDEGAGAPKPPLYGLYKVDVFHMDGQMIPALADDAGRWRYVAIEAKTVFFVKHMDDSLTKYTLHYDPTTHTAAIETNDPNEPMKSKGSLVASEQADGKLHLAGSVDGHAVDIDLERVDPQRFLLMNRGFHWISENSFFK